MPDLDVQIRSYFEATTRPVGVDDLLDYETPVVPPTAVPKPRIRRGMLVAAAAAAVIVVAFVFNLVVPGSEVPPITQPTPTTSLPLRETPPSELFDLTDWIAVYESPPNGGRSIDQGTFLIHPDGTGREEAGDIDARISNFGLMPDWSPDGTKLIMARGIIGIRRDSDRLYEVDLITNTTRALFACAGRCISDSYPAYSPDGSSIAFVRRTGVFVTMTDAGGGGSSSLADSSCGIWVGSVDSLEAEQITSDPACVTTSPRWSPSGGKLVYAMGDGADTSLHAIYVIDLATREISQITDFALDGAEPDWSPDGDWIVFGTHPAQWWDAGDKPQGNLYRVRPDGSDLQQLTFFDSSKPRTSGARYTPDGRWIVFSVDNEIWAMPSEGGEPLRLLTGGRYSQVDWQP